jgi:TRAP-type transport system periplasmic protein
MAAIAPEGTAWARELHALSREVERETQGAVVMKWYLGGIAGDEVAALERLKKGQLDGLAGALLCPRLAPSLWVTRVVGLFRERREEMFVLNRLRPIVDREMQEHGVVDLGITSFGSEIFFTREPIRSMADLRRIRVWTWNLDDLWARELPAMGVRAVDLPIDEAAAAYEDGRVDGFISVPTAALAFQWSARVKYFTALSAALLPGCVVVSQRTFDLLSLAQRDTVRGSTAKFLARFADVGETQDHALLSGLLQHQGVTEVPVSDVLRAEFYEAARTAREALAKKLLDSKHAPPTRLQEVISLLADFRAQR